MLLGSRGTAACAEQAIVPSVSRQQCSLLPTIATKASHFILSPDLMLEGLAACLVLNPSWLPPATFRPDFSRCISRLTLRSLIHEPRGGALLSVRPRKAGSSCI